MKKLSRSGIAVFASALLFVFSGCTGGIVTDYGGATVPASQPTTESSAVEESSEDEESSEAEESSEEEESSEAEESSEEEESSEAEESSEEEESSEAEESSAAEASAAAGDVKDYIYFDNSQTKWEKVCAYWWNDQFTPVTNKLTGELYPANGADGTQDLPKSWPGVEFEKVEGTEIYRAAVPVGATRIIFNSGVPDEDIKNGTEAYQTIDLDFSETDNAGQLCRIDTSDEPVAGRGKEKTKFRYGTISWEDYNG